MRGGGSARLDGKGDGHGKGRTARRERRTGRSPTCSRASASSEPTQFGRIFRPDEAWLAKAAPEPILEPDLPIVDTHHHLWDMRGLPLLCSTNCWPTSRTGHNVVATVFKECHSMYRAHGPAEMRPVGETEFVAGIAAMSDSGALRPDAGRAPASWAMPT